MSPDSLRTRILGLGPICPSEALSTAPNLVLAACICQILVLMHRHADVTCFGPLFCTALLTVGDPRDLQPVQAK